MADRDTRGRFVPGNQAAKGHGRPRKEQTEQYDEILYSVVTPERYERMVEKVASHIEQTGSVRAFEALANRMFGRPAVAGSSDDDDGSKTQALFAQLEILGYSSDGIGEE